MKKTLLFLTISAMVFMYMGPMTASQALAVTLAATIIDEGEDVIIQSCNTAFGSFYVYNLGTQPQHPNFSGFWGGPVDCDSGLPKTLSGYLAGNYSVLDTGVGIDCRTKVYSECMSYSPRDEKLFEILALEPVYGCTDTEAINYDSEATADDHSCEYPPEDVYGCTDREALNYNEEATVDDDTCEYLPEPVIGCMDPDATNYNPEATVQGEVVCTYPEPVDVCVIDDEGDCVEDSSPVYQCSDSQDNDQDGFTDEDDLGCSSSTDDNESDNPSVAGHKWEDIDIDGEWDEGEPGIEEWTVALGRAGESEGGAIPIEIIALELTGSGGEYSFSIPARGHYMILEESKDGWQATHPSVQHDSFFDITYGIDVEEEPALNTDSFFDIFVEVNSQQEGYYDFGNREVQEVSQEDACSNLEGNQETVPQGYHLDGGNCVEDAPPLLPPPPPPVDVCSNIDGIQESVPAGLILIGNECVAIGNGPPGDFGGFSFGMPQGGQVLGAATTIEEQIALLKEQIAALQNQLLGVLNQLLAQLQAQLASLLAQ